jgi:hypothetical protein
MRTLVICDRNHTLQNIVVWNFLKNFVLSSPGIIVVVVVVVAVAANDHFYIIIIYYNTVFSSVGRVA